MMFSVLSSGFRITEVRKGLIRFMPKILIIGGGYAGLLTAKKLEKKLKRDAATVVTMIDKNPFHTMLTELHEVAAGELKRIVSVLVFGRSLRADGSISSRLDRVR